MEKYKLIESYIFKKKHGTSEVSIYQGIEDFAVKITRTHGKPTTPQPTGEEVNWSFYRYGFESLEQALEKAEKYLENPSSSSL
jgi:hypothetical protein